MAKKDSLESAKRSFSKSITFRIIILISDSIIGYALTHRYDLTVGFVIFTNAASTAIYFFHERVWAHIKWGNRKK